MYIEQNALIGIWGYGIVGQSAVNFFIKQGYRVGVMDKRYLTEAEQSFLYTMNIKVWSEQQKEEFFNIHDYIFSSPGVNIGMHYATYIHRWITELDIFRLFWKKPIIAITGSIGKTSTMHLADSLLKHAGLRIAVGGNIGKPTFDLLDEQDTSDYALLETSSFQLQYCISFVPEIAIWTNVYPNHLDHHSSEQDYFLAKYAIMKHQQSHHVSIVPLVLREKINTFNPNKRTIIYISETKPHASSMESLRPDESIYYYEDACITKVSDTAVIQKIHLTEPLASFSFITNIITIAALSDLLSIDSRIVNRLPSITQLPPHRLEKVATYRGVEFYNDSKSTTIASTNAALNRLHNRSIHLFIGGLSKGVDRTEFIAHLPKNIQHVYCFGQEAPILHKICMNNNITATSHRTLDEAFDVCITRIQENNVVLLSPSGSSYDLYSNYEERGNHFKSLVHTLFI